MEQILKSMLRNDRVPDVYEDLSLITYIATSTENVVLSNRIETVSKIILITFKNVYLNEWDNFINILQENDEKPFIEVNNNKIFISNKWLFQVILLNSIRTVDSGFINRIDITFLHTIINYIIRYIRTTEKNSLYVLQTLQFILSKRSDVLTPSISSKLLKCMNIVALSPLTGFRSYAQGISKMCLTSLTIEEQQCLRKINNLPIRNIESYDLMTIFPQTYIHFNLVKVVNKIIKCFCTNIENKDGGIFYGRLLSLYSFEEWVTCIWPLLTEHLTIVDHDGEFFQSLIKYWIPFNVKVYRNLFYLFIRKKRIDSALKAYALLETRKRGFTMNLDLASDVSSIFCHPQTVNIALQIVSTYYKKSICPGIFECKLLLEFLYTNVNMFLGEEQTKSIKLLFSQIFLYAHNDLKKSEENFKFYQKCIHNIYNFCAATLEVEFFEVSAQILDIVLGISKGSHKNLTLLYKLEKGDFYEALENNLFSRLKSSTWGFDDSVFLTKLKHCFIKNGSASKILTNLLVEHYSDYDFVGVEYMRFILENSSSATLKNVEKVTNFSTVLLKDLNRDKKEFILEINDRLQNNLNVNCYTDEKSVFSNILYLSFLSASKQTYSKEFNFNLLLEKSLSFIGSLLEMNLINTGGYHTKKVLETFINTVINCVIKNLNVIMQNMDKQYTIEALIKIIEFSNMKKSVTLCAEALKQMFLKMQEQNDVSIKIQLLDRTLTAIRDTPVKSYLKIRRNPESRLVIYALCSSDKNPGKPLLRWVLDFLFGLISNKGSSDIATARALHCMEILVLDNALQSQTLQHITKIIKLCVELFIKNNWIIRNADLQLAKALIDRFFGVSLNFSNRPKNIEDLFVLFPELMPYFFKILSSEELDERSIMVFQFFFESQIKEQPWDHGIAEFLYCFQQLFVDIIKKYPNNYGKLAVKSFVAICKISYISSILYDISDYIKSNYLNMNRNIFANFVFLLQELYEKYQSSFEPDNIKEINFHLKDLISFLGHYNNKVFDFLLFKTEPLSNVLDAVLDKSYGDNYGDRLWLHNNLPYLVIHTKADQICNILDALLSENIPVFLRVKVLSILISRCENGNFITTNIQNILDIMFNKALRCEENKYLLICYYKVIVLLCQNVKNVGVLTNYNFDTSNLYKTMIFVIYLSLTKSANSENHKILYKTIESVYLKSIGINEEVDNDIISSLNFYEKITPKKLHSNLYKMVFHYSLHYSTYQEAYNLISLTNNQNFCSILAALKEFLSRISSNFIGNENDKPALFLELFKYIDKEYKNSEDNDGFYTIEGDNLAPKLFLQKILLHACR